MNLVLNWSANCVFANSTGTGTIAITKIKYFAPSVTLSSQDNGKLGWNWVLKDQWTRIKVYQN